MIWMKKKKRSRTFSSPKRNKRPTIIKKRMKMLTSKKKDRFKMRMMI